MAGGKWGGAWTDEKLETVRSYLDAYTTALKSQPFRLFYVDAFAGPGRFQASGGESASSLFGEDERASYWGWRRSSPRLALEVEDKPFDELIFVDSDKKHIASLEEIAGLPEFDGAIFMCAEEMRIVSSRSGVRRWFRIIAPFFFLIPTRWR